MVKLKNNSKGYALAITLVMMALLGGLGLGALNLSSTQGQIFTSQKFSTEAFWIADAGLQAACSSASTSSVGTSAGSLGAGTYSVSNPGGMNITPQFISTGNVDGSFGATRILQAICGINIFKYAAFAQTGGITSSGTTNVAIDRVNNPSGATGSLIATNNVSINTTGVNLSPGNTILLNAGLTLPIVSVPSSLLTASCPGGTGSHWTVSTNTTAPSGNYKCSYLAISSGATLTINSPVVLYLFDPSSPSPPEVDGIGGEDLRDNVNNVCDTVPRPATLPAPGNIVINTGGSLTIYALGRVSIGGATDYSTVNCPSNVVFNNQAQQATAFVIYSLYNSTHGAGVEIDNNSDPDLYALIYAPQALIQVNVGETITGSLIGNSINLDSGNSVTGTPTTINYDQNLFTAQNTISSWSECRNSTCT